MVRRETDKPASDIQARSLMARTFIDPEDMAFKEIIKNARRKLETPMAPAMTCKTCKKNNHGRPLARLMISSLNSHVSWKLVNPQGCLWKNLYRNIMRIISQEKRDNSLQHYNLVHKFIPMPQAMKIPAAKAAVDKEWENWRKSRRGT